MELLLDLVFRPLPASNITASSIFRAIEKYRPTLLLDEADTFLHNNDELRGILNSGYRRSSSYVIRTVGEDFEPVVFNTFGSKAIAQINTPPETIADRGIIIEMRRKKPDEKPERLRSDRIFNELEPLRRKALRWTRDNLVALKDREPFIPASLHDRAQDSWRPLLAIAELAGQTWAGYAKESAVRLSEDKSEISKRTLLLCDIQNLFRQNRRSRMTSADIAPGLARLKNTRGLNGATGNRLLSDNWQGCLNLSESGQNSYAWAMRIFAATNSVISWTVLPGIYPICRKERSKRHQNQPPFVADRENMQKFCSGSKIALYPLQSRSVAV
jgi:putative DNA primase/helicase